MSAQAKPRLGPAARHVIGLRLEGAKRRKVLGLIALHLDAGEPGPSVATLTRASGLQRGAVLALVEALERDGQLHVRRGDPNRGEVNTYLIPGLATTQTKGNTVSTSTTKPTHPPLIPAEQGLRKPWAVAKGGPDECNSWLKPLQPNGTGWPRYEEHRERHIAVVDAFVEAAGTDAEAEAVVALCEVTLAAGADILENVAEFFGIQGARGEEIEAVRPPWPLKPGEAMFASHPYNEESALFEMTYGAELRAMKKDRQWVEWITNDSMVYLKAYGAKAILEAARAAAQG